MRLKLEQAMDRHRLDTRRFTEPLRRASRRCRESDPPVTDLLRYGRSP